jgi:hypothetical protein
MDESEAPPATLGSLLLPDGERRPDVDNALAVVCGEPQRAAGRWRATRLTDSQDGKAATRAMAAGS